MLFIFRAERGGRQLKAHVYLIKEDGSWRAGLTIDPAVDYRYWFGCVREWGRRHSAYSGWLWREPLPLGEACRVVGLWTRLYGNDGLDVLRPKRRVGYRKTSWRLGRAGSAGSGGESVSGVSEGGRLRPGSGDEERALDHLAELIAMLRNDEREGREAGSGARARAIWNRWRRIRRSKRMQETDAAVREMPLSDLAERWEPGRSAYGQPPVRSRSLEEKEVAKEEERMEAAGASGKAIRYGHPDFGHGAVKEKEMEYTYEIVGGMEGGGRQTEKKRSAGAAEAGSGSGTVKRGSEAAEAGGGGAVKRGSEAAEAGSGAVRRARGAGDAAREPGRGGEDSAAGRAAAKEAAAGAKLAGELMQGRALLRSEARALLEGAAPPGASWSWSEAIQLASLLGRVRLGGAVAAADAGERRCLRCGSGEERMRRTPCASCGRECAYCEACLTMGRSRECELLVTGIYKSPLWDNGSTAASRSGGWGGTGGRSYAGSRGQGSNGERRHGMMDGVDGKEEETGTGYRTELPPIAERLKRWGLSPAQTEAAAEALRCAERPNYGRRVWERGTLAEASRPYAGTPWNKQNDRKKAGAFSFFHPRPYRTEALAKAAGCEEGGVRPVACMTGKGTRRKGLSPLTWLRRPVSSAGRDGDGLRKRTESVWIDGAEEDVSSPGTGGSSNHMPPSDKSDMWMPALTPNGTHRPDQFSGDGDVENWRDVAAVLLSLPEERTDIRSFLLWAVTGAGKTEMIFPLVESFLRRGGRALIATPRRDVVIELDPRIRRAFPEASVTTLYGGSEQRWERGDITLATTHQLFRFQGAFDLVVIDEIDAFPYDGDPHLHYAAEKSCAAYAFRVLLSATPPRSLQLAARRGRLAHAKVPVRYHRHPLPVPRLIRTMPVSRMLRTGKLPAALVHALGQSLDRGAQIFVFVQRIAYSERFAELLRSKLKFGRIEATSSKDPGRTDKVLRFRAGDIRILVTTTILERGVTIPRSDVFIMDADGALFSEAALVQMAGRAGRSADDPAGNVYFFSRERNLSQVRAVRHIRGMNRTARRKGFLLPQQSHKKNVQRWVGLPLIEAIQRWTTSKGTMRNKGRAQRRKRPAGQSGRKP